MEKEEVLYKIGYNKEDLEFLGSGSRARCFIHKPTGRVIKITADFEDFQMALKLKEKRNKTFTKVYDAYKVKVYTSYGVIHYYVIETKLQKRVVFEKCNREIIHTVTNLNHYFNERFRLENYTIDYKEYLESRGGDKDTKHTRVLYREYKKLFFTAKKMKTFNFDYHDENVSFSGGKIKVIDFGFGGYFNDIPDEVTKVQAKFTVSINY